MQDSDYKNIENLIGNVYQCIGGDHEFKVKIISGWIKSVQDHTPKTDPIFITRLMLDGKDFLTE